MDNVINLTEYADRKYLEAAEIRIREKLLFEGWTAERINASFKSMWDHSAEQIAKNPQYRREGITWEI